jgi:hypothetical protein
MVRAVINVALAAALVSMPATAQAGCWRADEVAAAKIKDLDTMMMVASLRCRASDRSILTRYNQFVVKNRAPLTQANAVLRAHFASAGGLNAYDRYQVKVANRYGAGTDGLKCDDFASITNAALSERPGFAALSALAERAGTKPMLDAPHCPVSVARR